MSLVLTSTDVVGRILSAVRAKPASNCIYIDTIADENTLFAHVGCELREASFEIGLVVCEVAMLPVLVKQQGIHLVQEGGWGSRDDKSPKPQRVERLFG